MRIKSSQKGLQGKRHYRKREITALSNELCISQQIQIQTKIVLELIFVADADTSVERARIAGEK